MLIRVSLFIVLSGLVLSNIAYAQTAQDYFEQGAQKAKDENAQGAVEDFTQAIKINPSFAAASS